ncbi:uncharacterized protein [Nicotiana sylvestris]|uniref:uncharacterized protein isoform X3 n=1 Tax=Nicotiana sylvestris TaxID=4096 RepID=UPI00388C487F
MKEDKHWFFLIDNAAGFFLDAESHKHNLLNLDSIQCHTDQEASLIYPIDLQPILHVDFGRGHEGFEENNHGRRQDEQWPN